MNELLRKCRAAWKDSTWMPIRREVGVEYGIFVGGGGELVLKSRRYPYKAFFKRSFEESAIIKNLQYL